jgi:uncharacterized protein
MSTDPGLRSELAAAVDSLGLVDHHVHGVHVVELPRAELELALSETAEPIPAWMSQLDSQVGFAIRRWCAPVLDLEPGVPADEYVRRRDALGIAEVSRRLLRSSNVQHYLVETGYQGDVIAGVEGMAELSGSAVSEVVRLEAELEALAAEGGADRFAVRFVERLTARIQGAVGLKSIIAYRHGLHFEPTRPDDQEVAAAAARWSEEIERTGQVRVTDPVLMRFALWAGVDTGLPIQFHVGFGDADIAMHLADPLLMRDFIVQVHEASPRTCLMLLHCYPFHRQAGYLAQVFPHVFLDVGLTINYTGARADAVVAESLELAPFAKILFSSDAWGPPELHHLGARLWRRGMVAAIAPWVEAAEWTFADAVRVCRMVGADNARRVYDLEAR